MVSYTEEQQKIAKSLLKSPKTKSELKKELSLPKKKLDKALLGLVDLKVLEEKDGKYNLIEYIERSVKMNKEQEKIEENYRIIMFIEALSENKEALEKQCDILESKIKLEPIKIIKFERGEVEKQEDNYTSFFELEVWVQDFKDILHLITNYGPSSIELLEPKSIQLNLNQTQEVLNEFASAVHYYISLIVQLTKETRERLGAK